MKTKDKQFGLRLEDAQFLWLRTEADKRGLSVAEIIRVIIDDSRSCVDMGVSHRVFQHNAYCPCVMNV